MSGRRVWCGPLIENWLTPATRCAPGRPSRPAHEVAAGFAVLLVLHRHAAHQQPVELPVRGQQHRRAQIEHLAQRVLTRRRGNRGFSARDRAAQPPEQQHLR
jgi:hypothetical protein